MKTKEEILKEKIIYHECHSTDPFTVYARMKKAALEAMEEYGLRQRMTGIQNTSDLYKHKFRDGFILGLVGAILTYMILMICTGKLF